MGKGSNRFFEFFTFFECKQVVWQRVPIKIVGSALIEADARYHGRCGDGMAGSLFKGGLCSPLRGEGWPAADSVEEDLFLSPLRGVAGTRI
jgi:hypothetical protein